LDGGEKVLAGEEGFTVDLLGSDGAGVVVGAVIGVDVEGWSPKSSCSAPLLASTFEA